MDLDARAPDRQARFWAGLLGRDVVEQAPGPLLPGPGAEVALRFVASESRSRYPNRMHLHLTSADAAAQGRTVATALRLGARHLDVGQRPEEGHVVLADPEDNEFRVVGPGSAFLAGCGLLAEVAGDGTRGVGVFWSRVLGWPLVWDRDGETAVQSPGGGTKLAWGGPPVPPKTGRNRQRLEVTPDVGEVEREVDRLTGLGARRLGPGGVEGVAGVDGAAELADPDGNELCLTSG